MKSQRKVVAMRLERGWMDLRIDHIQLTGQMLKSDCTFFGVFLIDLETLCHYTVRTERKVDAISKVYEPLWAQELPQVRIDLTCIFPK